MKPTRAIEIACGKYSGGGEWRAAICDGTDILHDTIGIHTDQCDDAAIQADTIGKTVQRANAPCICARCDCGDRGKALRCRVDLSETGIHDLVKRVLSAATVKRIGGEKCDRHIGRCGVPGRIRDLIRQDISSRRDRARDFDSPGARVQRDTGLPGSHLADGNPTAQ